MEEDSSPRERAPSSVLFQTDDRSIVVIDIPRSLEESQVPSGHHPTRRIVSAEPAHVPFETPEPRGYVPAHGSHAAQVAEMMTAGMVQSALEVLMGSYCGTFCLPRLVQGEAEVDEDLGYYVPPGAEILDGSIHDIRQGFLNTAPRFNLIVIDPPWPNRSVRRKEDSYNTPNMLFEIRQLLADIPVPEHLDVGGLVAVWITNKHRIHDLMVSPLNGIFASWGMELVAEWTWVKITAAGEPLFNIDSQWRKPWEKLLIARRIGSATKVAAKTIFAVPDIHSRKPNLRGLFEDACGKDYRGLEVFARNLTAGWYSWGDQVLRFQEKYHWQSEDESSASLKGHQNSSGTMLPTAWQHDVVLR